jgi:O-antigen ligase/polysaccharide polymerase Wzy-like membrane protein
VIGTTVDGVLLGRRRVRPTAVRPVAVPATTGSALVRGLLAAAFFGAILFEANTSDQLMELGTYIHRGIGSWTGLPILLTPLELLLLFALGVAIVSAAATSGVHASRADVAARLRGGWPILLFIVAVLGGLLRGLLGGGDAYIGLWELRYLLYIPACYLVVRAGLRTSEHVAGILRVGLVATALLGAEATYRRIALIDTGQLGVVPEFAYEHEDVLFLSGFVLFLLAAYVFGAFRRARLVGLLLAPLLLYALLATERRAGIIVLLVGIAAIALTALFVRRRAFILSALPVLVFTALYLVIFWNVGGILGQPARAIKSLYEPDPRDAASNLYRILETFDITVTIHSDPVFGVGFGRPFIMAIGLPDLSWWPFWHFETHNNILWVWLKTGVVGYLLFWTMVGGAVSRAAYAAKRLVDPTLRCAALFCLVAVVGTIVFAYVDLGLVSGRVTVLLGIALGILGVVERIDRTSARPALVAA